MPPAWTDVWICRSPRGHIQATGRDARGRKQYRYHPLWSQARDEAKYERTDRVRPRPPPPAPPRRRATWTAAGLPREKVMAAVVRLLETTLVRVGNEEYARDNRSYGLTTLRNRHANVSGSALKFTFRGKSGVEAHGRRPRQAPGQGRARSARSCPGSVCSSTSTTTARSRRSTRTMSTTTCATRWAPTSRPRTSGPGRAPSSPRARCATWNPARRSVNEAVSPGRLGAGQHTRRLSASCYIHPRIIDAHLDGSLTRSTTRRSRRASRAGRIAPRSQASHSELPCSARITGLIQHRRHGLVPASVTQPWNPPRHSSCTERPPDRIAARCIEDSRRAIGSRNGQHRQNPALRRLALTRVTARPKPTSKVGTYVGSALAIVLQRHRFRASWPPCWASPPGSRSWARWRRSYRLSLASTSSTYAQPSDGLRPNRHRPAGHASRMSSAASSTTTTSPRFCSTRRSLSRTARSGTTRATTPTPSPRPSSRTSPGSAIAARRRSPSSSCGPGCCPRTCIEGDQTMRKIKEILQAKNLTDRLPRRRGQAAHHHGLPQPDLLRPPGLWRGRRGAGLFRRHGPQAADSGPGCAAGRMPQAPDSYDLYKWVPGRDGNPILISTGATSCPPSRSTARHSRRRSSAATSS